MARYLVLSPTWCKAVATAETQMYAPGAVVEYAGSPGVALFPLDAAAREARWGILMKRNVDQRAADARLVHGWRARLQPKTAVAMLDAAMAEFASFIAEQEQAGKSR